MSDEVRAKCHEKKFHAYATYYILQKRFKKFMSRNRFINVSNILLPAIIGAIYFNFGTDAISSVWAIKTCSVLGLLSMIATCVSFALNWSNSATESLMLSNENYELYLKFKELSGEETPNEDTYRIFSTLNDNLDKRVLDLGINEKERREGYRASLIQFNMQCSSCGEIPKNMKPSNCQVCGNF